MSLHGACFPVSPKRPGAAVTEQVRTSLSKTSFSKVAVRGHSLSSSLGEAQLPAFLPTLGVVWALACLCHVSG